MNGKRLRDWDRADIKALIADEIAEDDQIEFKGDLPSNQGRRQDPWYSGGSVGDKAKREIVEEVIAFANGHGGVVIVGIDETKAKPARAECLTPIPRCADLEEVFKMVCRDWIEPRLAIVDVRGIPTADDGSGVLAIHVPKSMAGPHRHKDTLHCYVRRADSSEKITMREIQDLTLQLDRGIAGIARRFEDRLAEFSARRAGLVGESSSLEVRATLLPLTPVQVAPVHGNAAFQPPWNHFVATPEGWTRAIHIARPVGNGGLWKPVIRGSHREDKTPSASMVREVYCDGLIEYRFGYDARRDDVSLPYEWFICILANALCAAEKFRIAAGAPNIEYGLQLAMLVNGGFALNQYENPDPRLGIPIGAIPVGATYFPRYSVGPLEEFQDLTTLFQRDLNDLAEAHDFTPLMLDYDEAMRSA